MNDTRISALPPAQGVSGDELLPAVQAGANVAMTPAQLLAHILDDPATVEALRGAAGLLHPGYLPGLSYCPPFLTVPSGVVAVPDTLYAIPMPIARACTVNAIGFRVTASATGSAHFGIYASAGGRPGGRIAEGALAPSTGGAVSAELALAAPTPLVPGLYWLAALFSGTPTVQFTGASERNLTPLVGATGTYGSVNTQNGGVSATAPAPFADGLPALFGPSALAPRVPLLTVTMA
jgi:hypothetical protein